MTPNNTAKLRWWSPDGPRKERCHLLLNGRKELARVWYDRCSGGYFFKCVDGRNSFLADEPPRTLTAANREAHRHVKRMQLEATR